MIITTDSADPLPLASGVVIGVTEDRCGLAHGGATIVAEYAPQLPAPRIERFSPGHRVAFARTADGRVVVLWRWYDAVVIGTEGDLVRLWEPAHGEVLAVPRVADHGLVPGMRAYLSAGLPGAEWWVAGRARAGDEAGVELDAVVALYTEHGLWSAALAPRP